MIITRKLEFDAGHRLLNHEGKCAYLHGHRYVAEISVESPSLDSIGRVVDFSVVKEEVGGWIDKQWDHNILLHPEDPLWSDLKTVQGTARDLKLPWCMLDGRRPVNPTVENMAKTLFQKSQDLLVAYDTIKVVGVRLYETPNCWADYESPKI